MYIYFCFYGGGNEKQIKREKFLIGCPRNGLWAFDLNLFLSLETKNSK